MSFLLLNALDRDASLQEKLSSNLSFWNHDLAVRLLIMAAVLVATMMMRKLRKTWLRQLELNDWIALAHKQRDNKMHQVLSLTTVAMNRQLWTASETSDLIRAGKSSATDNIAYLSRQCRTYGRADKGINGITEEFYDDAYESASRLDIRSSDQKPLLGVPICVKDCIGIKGSLSTGGLACRLHRRDPYDALVITALKQAGGIPLVKGNVVQGMGLSESVNRIWGRSRNPWDLDRTPGGSSSGDAALVSSGCVPLSVSADGAGSIRIPASFCGVVGFKPSPARLSSNGCMRPKKDNKFGSTLCVPAVIGPMARSVDDCALFMKAVFSSAVYRCDRNIPPLNFDERAYRDTSKLKVGYFITDSFMDPCATGKRALKEAITALEQQGHTCVPFQPPTDGWHHNKLFVGITQAEGNMKSTREALAGEPMIPDYAPLVGAAAVPNFIRPIAQFLLPKRIGHLLSLSSKLCCGMGELSNYVHINSCFISCFR